MLSLQRKRTCTRANYNKQDSWIKHWALECTGKAAWLSELIKEKKKESLFSKVLASRQPKAREEHLWSGKGLCRSWWSRIWLNSKSWHRKSTDLKALMMQKHLSAKLPNEAQPTLMLQWLMTLQQSCKQVFKELNSRQWKITQSALKPFMVKESHQSLSKCLWTCTRR